MSVIAEIDLAIKSYSKGLISESECVDLISASVNVYQRNKAGIPAYLGEREREILARSVR